MTEFFTEPAVPRGVFFLVVIAYVALAWRHHTLRTKRSPKGEDWDG